VQQFNAPPRDAYTAAQVRALIIDSPTIVVGKGCETIDPDTLLATEDISDDLGGGTVRRGSYDTLHGQAHLLIAREMNWGSGIIRPYMTLSDGTTTMRFNLGAYFIPTPRRSLGQDPLTYEVDCYDILARLDDPVGSSYSVPAATAYLAAVEEILIGQNCVYTIDQTAASSVLPSPMSWPVADNPTWLTVVNGLLGPIGYQGIWSDWDGVMRVQPYVTPRDRASEMTLSTNITESILAQDPQVTRDFDKVPNRWIGYRQNNIDDVAPVDGAGRYETANDSDGDTSIDSRGRTITRVESFDVADQAALIAAVEAMAAADMTISTKIEHHTAPNPLHWHFDRLTVVDSRLGGAVEILDTAWELDLDGTDMAHEWTVL